MIGWGPRLGLKAGPRASEYFAFPLSLGAQLTKLSVALAISPGVCT